MRKVTEKRDNCTIILDFVLFVSMKNKGQFKEENSTQNLHSFHLVTTLQCKMGFGQKYIKRYLAFLCGHTLFHLNVMQ